MSSKHPISAVPTNIITGFLGAGKTSAILQLMKQKPDHQRWAILVNEFGEIGVDGSLFKGQHKQPDQVFIREVPGGCMCCAAGLPMQIALNQLLTEAKPDRLLIEPTGLGHPKEVLQVLSSAHYREVLSLQKTLTLVDARQLSDKQYTHHDTFNQQIAISDTIVGNKVDLYHGDEKQQLESYIQSLSGSEKRVIFSKFGAIPYHEFEGPTRANEKAHHHHDHGKPKVLAADLPMPESGIIKAVNQGEGFRSIGWRFSPDKVFCRKKLTLMLLDLKVERMKAVFITDLGVLGYNMTSDGLSEAVLDDGFESRVEFISQQLDDNLEAKLLACLLT
ncbi:MULTISPECIES: CobW family GTP-binding protein [Vibrio]|uniref:CobW family GTP-binding protein n=1 Tax=Vibrio TaxID=662 RepID=UPI00207614AC|nr:MULTISPECIES: GTP-binding protein [Vibrio]USD34560.1 GTP-binding protein [Vibrio sp. SCSIO 43186]USD47628.1 GTP-binding protein [Vibrio sp. SCSIO 43145]USD71685.1 GTP-binding protein [Vibrio sp. SCSIO 43139]USD98589.1 cobalamin biosynthesis protein CobW [Vibrio coralliilyticus]